MRPYWLPVDCRSGYQPPKSLLPSREKVLITGDAAVAERGRLELANPQFCLDLEQAEHSLERLRNTPCTRYICCHGGVLEKG